MDFFDYESDTDLTASGVQKHVMPLFLIVDTSGSMEGEKIQQVETAVENIKVELARLNMSNDDADVKLSVLCFDTAPRWECKVEDPSSANPNFRVGGLTNMGAAFKELETMLSRSQLIQKGQCAGFKRAVLILLTDGVPTDDVDAGIATLMKNHWFVKGTRIGFAIGEDADRTCLKKFTGNSETVLNVNNVAILSTILANVAVVASTTATHASSEGEGGDTSLTTSFTDTATEAGETVKNAIEVAVIENPEISQDDAEDLFGNW